jgi:hypothetical protein
MQTWWQDRTLSPFITAAGASIEPVVMALVPFNRHLRVVEGMALPPVAVSLAYQAHARWRAGPGADPRLRYLSHLAIVLAVVPPLSRSPRPASASVPGGQGGAGAGAGVGPGAGAGAASAGSLPAGGASGGEPGASLCVRSHHPDDVMNESQYRAAEVGAMRVHVAIALPAWVRKQRPPPLARRHTW